MSAHVETPPSLLVDTNVWLDYYLGWRSGHAAAAELIVAACEQGAELLYAAPAVTDVFYLVAVELKRRARAAAGGTLEEGVAAAAGEAAWGCIEHLDEIAGAVGCDGSDLWTARKQKPLHADFEDDLLIAAAMRSNASLLVTNDAALIAHAPVAALSVADALRYLRTR